MAELAARPEARRPEHITAREWQKHWPMIVVWPASLVALMLLSLGLGYLLHVVIEKPSLRIRERVAA